MRPVGVAAAVAGGVPSAWAGLGPSLRVLDLSTNKLGGSLAAAPLAALKHLRVLDLHCNGFAGPLPPALFAPAALATLSLYLNRLDGPIPPAVGGAVALTSLDLHGCASDLSPFSLSFFPPSNGGTEELPCPAIRSVGSTNPLSLSPCRFQQPAHWGIPARAGEPH
eukprot:SM007742S22541  [mRNA]  locus=s7742:107:604:- [translate_table: standard]